MLISRLKNRRARTVVLVEPDSSVMIKQPPVSRLLKDDRRSSNISRSSQRASVRRDVMAATISVRRVRSRIVGLIIGVTIALITVSSAGLGLRAMISAVRRAGSSRRKSSRSKTSHRKASAAIHRLSSNRDSTDRRAASSEALRAIVNLTVRRAGKISMRLSGRLIDLREIDSSKIVASLMARLSSTDRHNAVSNMEQARPVPKASMDRRSVAVLSKSDRNMTSGLRAVLSLNVRTFGRRHSAKAMSSLKPLTGSLVSNGADRFNASTRRICKSGKASV